MSASSDGRAGCRRVLVPLPRTPGLPRAIPSQGHAYAAALPDSGTGGGWRSCTLSGWDRRPDRARPCQGAEPDNPVSASCARGCRAWRNMAVFLRFRGRCILNGPVTYIGQPSCRQAVRMQFRQFITVSSATPEVQELLPLFQCFESGRERLSSAVGLCCRKYALSAPERVSSGQRSASHCIQRLRRLTLEFTPLTSADFRNPSILLTGRSTTSCTATSGSSFSMRPSKAS